MAGKVCDRYCRRCMYYINLSGGLRGLKCCNYLIMTDKRRPCDPGKGCTVRELRNPKWSTRKDGKNNG